MAVTSAASTNGLTSAATGLTSGVGGNLGKTEFLQLLITQLQHQDPLSPMENEAFLSQLAQFSSLEQMTSLNEKLDNSMLLTQSLNNSAAAGLIGRNVRANGEVLELGDTGEVELGYFLQAEAQSVELAVYDETGALVRTLRTSDGGVGAHSVAWDGKDDSGTRLPAGRYGLAVKAADSVGADVSVLTIVTGRVDGVTFKNGSALLLVNGQELPLSSLLEVYQ